MSLFISHYVSASVNFFLFFLIVSSQDGRAVKGARLKEYSLPRTRWDECSGLRMEAWVRIPLLTTILFITFSPPAACEKNRTFFFDSTINNGNMTEWSPIPIIRVINKIRFINHEYDYRQNWTTRSPVTN